MRVALRGLWLGVSKQLTDDQEPHRTARTHGSESVPEIMDTMPGVHPVEPDRERVELSTGGLGFELSRREEAQA